MIIYILMSAAWIFSSILFAMVLALAIKSEPPAQETRHFSAGPKKQRYEDLSKETVR